MRKLLKHLASLWMVLAIALLPLQAFSATASAAGSEPCASHTAASESHAGHHAEAPSGDGCPHCNQQDCDPDDCSGGSCSGLHLHPAIPFCVTVQLYFGAVAADALPASGVLSRSDPPPLRPPV